MVAELAAGRAAVYTEADSVRKVEDFDGLIVRWRKPCDPTVVDEVCVRGLESTKFERPLTVNQEGSRLQIVATHAEGYFPLERVESIQLYERAPERPWIIVGVALLTAAAVGTVSAYAVRSQGGDDSGLGILSVGVVTGGLAGGLTLPFTVPATKTLGRAQTR